jgi:hypothetical protein
MIQKQNFFHYVFNSLDKFKYHLLLFGLAIWLLSPIFGIIPLLLFSQINVSQTVSKKNLKLRVFNFNSFSLLLVLFTVVVAASTHTVISDLQVYVEIYNGLGKMPLLEYMSSYKMEPITFIIPSLINWLFQPGEYSFILVQSLTMNLAFMLIAMKFMPSYYPTIILLNITSNSYFIQVFLMRQFYSFIFLVCFIYTFSLWKKIILFLLSISTHSGTLLFLCFSMISLFLKNNIQTENFNIKLINNLTSFFNKFIRQKIGFYGICFFAFILMPILFAFLKNDNSLITSIFPTFSDRLEVYGENNSLGLNQDIWKVMIFDICFLLTSVSMINFSDEEVSCYVWSIMLLLSIACLAAFYYILPAFGRLTYFLSGLSGFFYTIIFNSNQLTHRLNLFSSILFIAIFTKIGYFYYVIVLSSFSDSSFIFNGNPLGANIFNYFEYLYDGLT